MKAVGQHRVPANMYAHNFGHTSALTFMEQMDGRDDDPVAVYAGTFVMKAVEGATRPQLEYWSNDSGHFKPHGKYAKYVSAKFGFPMDKFRRVGPAEAHFMRDNLLDVIFDDDYADDDDVLGAE